MKSRLGRFLLMSSLAIGAFASAHAQETVKLGLVGPFTGPAANTGITVRATYELAVKEVNEKGGVAIDGEKRLIELVSADSQSKPSIGSSAAQKLLTRDEVDIVVGDLLHSDVTLALMEIATAYPDTFFWAPLSVTTLVGDRISEFPEKYRNVWKGNGESTGYVVSIPTYLKTVQEKGTRSYPSKTVALLGDETEYTKSMTALLDKALEKDGWKIVLSETVPLATTDFYPQLAKVRAANPDVIISNFLAPSTGVALIKQMKEQDIKGDHVAVYFPSLTSFREAITTEAANLVFFGSALDSQRSERGVVFAAKLKAAGIGVSPDAATGYCSAVVLLKAVELAGSTDQAKIGEQMAKMDYDECPNYVRIRYDAKRHAPVTGEDGYFTSASQFLKDTSDFVIVWPKKAATGTLDKGPLAK